MANVLMAAKQTATSTLGVVTTAAQSVEAGVTAAGVLLKTAEAHANAYHNRSVTVLKLDEAGAMERKIEAKAVEDAHFYKDLKDQLKDPDLHEHYLKALARYKTIIDPSTEENNITQIAAE